MIGLAWSQFISRFGSAFFKVAAAIVLLLFVLYLFVSAINAGVSKVSDMISAARQETRIERDAYWQGQIDASNAKVAAAQTAQAENAIRLQALYSGRVRDTQMQLSELEKQNAALPKKGQCGGIGRARVRLLNQQ